MPKYMMTYDVMETARNTNEWLGATARAMASYPAFGLVTNPAFKLMAAWGEVTERSFSRMVAKPDWGIHSVTGEDGRDHLVTTRAAVKRPFGDLVEFHVAGRAPMKRRILLVAPMSGHYATLLRSTVRSLLPDADVYVTDWHNARDIPVSAGKFDVEDYTLYLADFMRALGPETHVVAVCQPVPLALAATAHLAAEEPEAQPATLILIGGPVDPDANATDVTDFGHRVTMGQLERHIVQRVGFKYAGAGRMVYPGLLQLASFVSMNAERHTKAFSEQILRTAKGEAADHDKHNRFYDEYLAVMDMTAEFYLSTVERIFKGREIARNAFTVAGRAVDLGRITDVAVKVVEGEEGDISAPGQCLAALDLLTGVPADRKASHLEPGAGHYGIFAGGSWRRNIRPLVLDFIDANARGAAEPVGAVPEREPEAAPATLAEAERIAEGETSAGSVRPTRRAAPRRAPARRGTARAEAAPSTTRRGAPKRAAKPAAEEASKADAPASTRRAAKPVAKAAPSSATGAAPRRRSAPKAAAVEAAPERVAAAVAAKPGPAAKRGRRPAPAAKAKDAPEPKAPASAPAPKPAAKFGQAAAATTAPAEARPVGAGTPPAKAPATSPVALAAVNGTTVQPKEGAPAAKAPEAPDRTAARPAKPADATKAMPLKTEPTGASKAAPVEAKAAGPSKDGRGSA